HRGADAHEPGPEAAADDEGTRLVRGRHRRVPARRHVAGDGRVRLVADAEHADAAAHADRTGRDAQAYHHEVFGGVRVDAHVALRLYPRAGADVGAGVVAQHGDVAARGHADRPEARTGRQRDVVEVVARGHQHRLVAVRGSLVGVD